MSFTQSEINAKPPEPICIIRKQTTESGETRIVLDVEALTQILLQDRVRDKHVVVVSIAGAYRQGKSFMLNFFQRYLERQGSRDWMGHDDEELSGFSWKNGSEPDTTGILLWSEPFISKLPTGEEVVILLMDTQGAFCSNTTLEDCSAVFALSALMSSVQIYNVSRDIQEDFLQHLQCFIEYGRLAKEECRAASSPFQRLEFLVRDWQCPYEYDYGESSEFLAKRLSTLPDQHQELQTVRNSIQTNFQKIGCFLMPHPGLTATTQKDFKGKLKDINEDFKNCLQILVPRLLAPENLFKKEFLGREITCSELLDHFKELAIVFSSGVLPRPMHAHEAMVETLYTIAQNSSIKWYENAMSQVCGGDQAFLNPARLAKLSNEYKSVAMQSFEANIKLRSLSSTKRRELEDLIDQAHNKYMKWNEEKCFLRFWRTLGVLSANAIVTLVLAKPAAACRFAFLAKGLINHTYGCVIAAAGRVGVHASGIGEVLGNFLDKTTGFIARKLWQPVIGVGNRVLQPVIGVGNRVFNYTNDMYRKAKDYFKL